jgi:molybdenum cofactor biosynthesis enzyme MoaA
VLRTIGSQPEEFEGQLFWNCNIVSWDGQTYVFSHRAILTIVVVAACNAACRFCSNEITFTPSGPFLKWDERLKRVKDFALLAGVTKVAFTGGEPTLNPQALHDLVAAVTPGFRRARLHTNAHGLFKKVDTGNGARDLLPALIAKGLTGVSVSVAHHDQEVNRSVMRFARTWNGMPDAALAEIAAHRSEQFVPRLSCVMTHEGVNSMESMVEYMAWGRALGFRHFIFRSCSEIPSEFQKPTAYSEYNNVNHLSIEPIVAALDRSGRFEKVYQQRKSDSKVDVYRWDDVTFDVDESSEEADPDRKVRRLNVMPDGGAYTSWIDPLAVLFDDDRALAERSRRREFQLGER